MSLHPLGKFVFPTCYPHAETDLTFINYGQVARFLLHICLLPLTSTKRKFGFSTLNLRT